MKFAVDRFAITMQTKIAAYDVRESMSVHKNQTSSASFLLVGWLQQQSHRKIRSKVLILSEFYCRDDCL